MELQIIQKKIYEVRGMRVLLDFDLAEMYGVETKNLKRAVNRNLKRFPPDFMFQLTPDEWENLRCNFGTSSWGGHRYLPYAFSEQGVAMLSGLLNSDVAIEVNISIMRTFVAIRNYLMQKSSTSKEIEKLWHHIKLLEEQAEDNLKAINDFSDDNQNTFDEIYIALSELANKQNQINMTPRKRVGYVRDDID